MWLYYYLLYILNATYRVNPAVFSFKLWITVPLHNQSTFLPLTIPDRFREVYYCASHRVVQEIMILLVRD